VFFPPSLRRLFTRPDCIWVTRWVSTAYPSRAPEFYPRFFLVGSVLLIFFVVFCCCFILLCVFTFWVPCCHVRYDFRIKTMFGSSLPPVVCRKAHECLIYVICVCLRIVRCNTYCVVFLFYFSSSCVPNVASFSGLSILDCPFSIL